MTPNYRYQNYKLACIGLEECNTLNETNFNPAEMSDKDM